jgi:hypothetical protein
MKNYEPKRESAGGFIWLRESEVVESELWNNTNRK